MSATITAADIRAQVVKILASYHIRKGVDLGGIVREIIDSYGLIDIEGWHPVTGRSLISDDEFWVIAQRHGGYRRGTLLAEVQAATDALRSAHDRRLAACQAAFDAGISRDEIAAAAGLTRDGLYKLLRRRGAVAVPSE